MDFDAIAGLATRHIARTGPLLDRLEKLLPKLEALIAAREARDAPPAAQTKPESRGKSA